MALCQLNKLVETVPSKRHNNVRSRLGSLGLHPVPDPPCWATIGPVIL